ncbi:MAG: hypothetical protein ACK4I0_03265 [Brevundimonas sp.]|uniref:hypothetical protein n=1 Tax=Brevundimonas sp. TaxID=1871086 RepID=UPI003919344D
MSDQFSLFGEGGDRLQAPVPKPVDHEARARAKLTRVLEQARAADRMPWDDRNVRMWQTVFPQMARWLPDEEAEQMTRAFQHEIARLKAA